MQSAISQKVNEPLMSAMNVAKCEYQKSSHERFGWKFFLEHTSSLHGEFCFSVLPFSFNRFHLKKKFIQQNSNFKIIRYSMNRFASAGRLTTHVNVTHMQHGQDYTCHKCDKKFACRSNLSYHLTTHEPKVRQVQCLECGKW